MARATPMIAAIDSYVSRTGATPTTLKDVDMPDEVRAVERTVGLFYERNSPEQYMLSFRFPAPENKYICNYLSDQKKWQCLAK